MILAVSPEVSIGRELSSSWLPSAMRAEGEVARRSNERQPQTKDLLNNSEQEKERARGSHERK